ncbi:TIGR04222 domain-containing membrane protein [Streptomyces sp. NBC_00091]|uniref:TIGR04222 domain-containing membrane protein n=1 Tax=Streptomyces sp. NBC_00091 TaxID=2975648 RepID=UPI00225B2099|nr:TIGR04222 domain-containing membrane protein [Streptomyces sp. NBC_00091]MCX5381322.1 TIGR04222 domain-containing membrane protein [Streptomyces sp. NBC_00091]
MFNAVSAGAAWLLLLTAAALRLRPCGQPAPGRLDRRLSPAALGLLRAGARGAAQTGLVELYLAGSVRAGWRQTVRPGEARLPRGCSEVARAQYHVLYGPLHPRRLQGIERVRDAIRRMSAELERAGLLVSRRRAWVVRGLLLPVFAAAPLAAAAGGRTAWMVLGLLADAAAVTLWAGPRRTLSGAALLTRMRRDHEGARRATEHRPDELLMSVALFGAPALRAQLPRFTEESGLLTRPPREPMDRGGGSGEAFASCGG